MTLNMAKNITQAALSVMAACILAVSCGKNNTESTYSTQGGYIENITATLTPEGSDATVDYFDGIVRITVSHGEGESLNGNGKVSFLYAGYRISSSSLSASSMFATNNKELAESSGWNVSDTSIFKVSTIDLSEDKIVKGLEKGLPGVKRGDECYILFNGKYGFGKHKTGNVPGNSALAYHLWIADVANN